MSLPIYQAVQYVSTDRWYLSSLSLDLCRTSHPDFSDSDAEQLAIRLPSFPTLQKLEIIKCPNLGPRGVSILCGALPPAVYHLAFEDVPLGSEGLQILTEFLEQRARLLEDGASNGICQIQSLGLENIGSTDKHVWEQFLRVATKTLQSLDLARNELGLDHVSTIAQGLKEQSNLKSLILSGNPIGDEGMFELCRAISTCRNGSLKLMALGSCDISDVGIHGLALTMRTNRSLQRLYVYGNSQVHLDSQDNKEIRYWLELNSNGRNCLHRHDFPLSLLPSVLARASEDPKVLYGLLQELPHVLCRGGAVLL